MTDIPTGPSSEPAEDTAPRQDDSGQPTTDYPGGAAPGEGGDPSAEDVNAFGSPVAGVEEDPDRDDRLVRPSGAPVAPPSQAHPQTASQNVRINPDEPVDPAVLRDSMLPEPAPTAASSGSFETSPGVNKPPADTAYSEGEAAEQP